MYQSQRTRTWLKIKCSRQQEYVIGGYTESGAGRPFGSLLAGYFNREGEFIFCGKIKSGYGSANSKALLETLKQHEQSEPSFVNPPSGREYRNPHWLKPELVAEVAFGEISGTGLLRHASFKGLREDKNAREVGIELPEPLPNENTEPEPEREAEPEPRPPEPPAAKERPVFPHERITRDEIMEYYNMVSGRMLPYIADRPLTLIVCRTNIYACKFTKHATNLPAPVKAIDAGHEERYIAVDSLAGLQALVKAGVVELHGWQSRYTDLERPDRIIFDLDPPGEPPLPRQRLAEAALLLRLHLQEKGFESFLQTTGGKGYYVVVPLRPAATWKTVTPFAKRVARDMEARYPDRFTARLAKEERKGRIYVDWMRNGRGANAAEPYSIRARPGAPVATPITWEELVDGVSPDAFNVRNMGKRLDEMACDPWQDYLEASQQLGED